MVHDTVAWWAWLLPPAFAAPWIVGIAYRWSRARPRDGSIPPSAAEMARKRLWMQ